MYEELKQRANESAGRMARAGMTLSTGVLEELVAAVEQQERENAAQAAYIRFIEAELLQVQAGNSAALENAKGPEEETPQRWELPLNQMVLAGG